LAFTYERGWAALALAVVACGACGQRGGAPAPVPSPSVTASVQDAAALAPDAASAKSWVEAVRRERWDDAAQALDTLPEADKRKPEVLYARARVAIARDHTTDALPLLEGLESALPLLAPDIAYWRAEVELEIGPFPAAGEYFASRPTAQAWLKAARAFERAKDPSRARGLCARVVSADKRTRLQEAAGRACRVRLAEPDDKTAATDARWVALHAPDAPEAKLCDDALPRLDPAHPLTGEELMARARALADAGRTEDALKALDRVAGAPEPKVRHLDELRLRGDVLYRARGRSLEAAKVLDECAQAGGPHAGEDAFHAARALSRADHDDDAIWRMTRLARAQPKTPWGDEASFFVPYLHLLHGQWRDAASGFDEYVLHYPNGVERRDAARNRALAHLMTHDWPVARKLFEQLAADDPDAIGSARALTLAALAALHDGDRTHALARWADVAHNQPLSWPALVARARLVQEGAAVPPAIEPAGPAPAPPAIAIDLPPPVDVLHRVGLETDAESALREREGLVTSHAPAGRGLEALCAAYGALGRGRRRYQIAQQVPAALLAEAPSDRTRWAWECVYPAPYPEDVVERVTAEPLAASIAYAVMRQESSFDPDAVSPAHAVGLMQLVPETAAVVAASLHLPFVDADSIANDAEVKLRSPSTSLLLGMHHLHDLVDRFHGQVALAVAAYNAGVEPISRWASRAPGMDLDAFVEHIPYAETRAYVAKVMGNYARYEYLRHGEEGVPRLVLSVTDRNAP
jgi:soluble lytic murein transglycosylase